MPDVASILRGFYLDERVPCDRLPILLPESVFPRIPKAEGRTTPITAVLNMSVDSTGRVPSGSWRVINMSDPALLGAIQVAGLRFVPLDRKQGQYRTVRCTVTVKPEP
jgi:hypothetical protein